VDWLDQILHLKCEIFPSHKRKHGRFFQFEKDLRQGDPKSPFLFLIAMEGLNHMFRKAKTNEWVRGFSALAGRGEELEITHLFYANDALIFCEAEEA